MYSKLTHFITGPFQMSTEFAYAWIRKKFPHFWLLHSDASSNYKPFVILISFGLVFFNIQFPFKPTPPPSPLSNYITNCPFHYLSLCLSLWFVDYSFLFLVFNGSQKQNGTRTLQQLPMPPSNAAGNFPPTARSWRVGLLRVGPVAWLVHGAMLTPANDLCWRGWF